MQRCEIIHEIGEIGLMVREVFADIDSKYRSQQGGISCPEVKNAIDSFVSLVMDWHGSSNNTKAQA